MIRCQAKYASGLDFKCNDDWLTNHKTRDIKHWKDDNGVEHVSGSIKIKACFHFQIYFLKNKFLKESSSNLGRRSYLDQFGPGLGPKLSVVKSAKIENSHKERKSRSSFRRKRLLL